MGTARGRRREARVRHGRQHPHHLAFKVSGEELERLAAEHGAEIAVHRDDSRSFYLEAPGDARVEVIAYPDALEEDFE